MKRLIALLPSGHDWFSTVEHALAFGLSAALAIRVVPAIFHAIGLGTPRNPPAHGPHRAFLRPSLKVFGQRR